MNKLYTTLIIFISSLFLFTCQSNSDTKIILIGIDGLSTDGIQCAKTPNLNRLIKDGALSLKARGVMPTVSAPNWGSMLCGAGPEQHGITNNGWTASNHTIEPTIKDEDGYFPSIFTLIFNQIPNAKSAIFYDWKELMDLYNGKYISKIQFDSSYDNVYKHAIDYILKESPDFTFIYAGHVDEIGHKYQHGSEQYYKSIEEIDNQIGQLLNSLDSTGLYKKTNIIVISDHGGVGYGHGGESMDEIQVPWIIEGPRIIKNKLLEEPINTLNTACTIAYLFGLKQPDCWIGKPVLSAFLGSEKAEINKNIYLPKPKPSIKSGIYSEKENLIFSVDNNTAEIRYTSDGSDPNENSVLYSKPINLDASKIVKAIAINGKIKSELTIVNFNKVLHIKNIYLLNQPSTKYPAEFNGYSLFDAKLGNDDFNNSAWMGFEFEDFEAVVDLGENQSVKKISLSCLENHNAWIFLPSQIEYYISDDNKKFVKIGNLDSTEIKSPEKRNRTLIEKKFENLKSRYLKVIAKNIKYCPTGHPGEGGKAWLFVDELLVE
jgi:hypothetical protein